MVSVLYFLCCCVNRSACLVCCGSDSVCELFGNSKFVFDVNILYLRLF